MKRITTLILAFAMAVGLAITAFAQGTAPQSLLTTIATGTGSQVTLGFDINSWTTAITPSEGENVLVTLYRENEAFDVAALVEAYEEAVLNAPGGQTSIGTLFEISVSDAAGNKVDQLDLAQQICYPADSGTILKWFDAEALSAITGQAEASGAWRPVSPTSSVGGLRCTTTAGTGLYGLFQ